MEEGKLVGKGISFKLFEFLTKKYNFTYEIIPHDRNIIGSQDDLEGSLLESLYTNVNISRIFIKCDKNVKSLVWVL